MGRFVMTQEDLNRGKLIDPQWYPVEITKYEAGKAKTDNSGLDKFAAKILTDDAELVGVPLYFQFSEKAPGFVAPFYYALTGEKVKPGDDITIGQNCVGKQLDVHVSRTEYQGKPQNSVDGFRPLGSTE